jgi:hypothetical protein
MLARECFSPAAPHRLVGDVVYGFRVLPARTANRVNLYSRPSNDLTDRFQLKRNHSGIARTQDCRLAALDNGSKNAAANDSSNRATVLGKVPP